METVEVFKTNVENVLQAAAVLGTIRKGFENYQANFDLEDCDKILRIKSVSTIESSSLIALIGGCGFKAEILSDEIPPYMDSEIMLSTH